MTKAVMKMMRMKMDRVKNMSLKSRVVVSRSKRMTSQQSKR